MVLPSELASLADLAGDGDTGATTGTTTGSCLTTAPTPRIAESSLIAITLIAPVDFMAVALAAVEVSAHRGMDSRLARIPERSAASIMEELPEASRLADSPASAEVFMGAEVSMGVEVAAVGGNTILAVEPTDDLERRYEYEQ